MFTISFSWDDGSPFDLKLVELHEKYQIPCTLFVPNVNSEGLKVMNPYEIKNVHSNLIDIGCHTKNHTYLNTIPMEKVYDEVMDNKKYLEDILGSKVSKFCFPGGKYNKNILRIIDGEFETLRTANTMNSRFEGYLRTPTFHFFQRGLKSNLLNTIKQKDSMLKIIIPGLLSSKDDFEFMDYCIEKMNLDSHFYKLHVYGHSWEINDFELWEKLEKLFKSLSNNYKQSIVAY